MHPIHYIRRQEVLDRLGVSNSTLFNRINERLFVPPVPLGGRAVGWIEHEVDTILRALATGLSRQELKSVVQALVCARSSSQFSDPKPAAPISSQSTGHLKRRLRSK